MRTIRPAFLSFLFVFACSVLVAGCKKGPAVFADHMFVNFDPETTDGLLKKGWSGWERTPEGDTFVWSLSRVAEVSIMAPTKNDKTVRMRVWPFRYPGCPNQQITFYLNGVRLKTMDVGTEKPTVLTFETPEAAWIVGENSLKFEFAYAESPKERIPGFEDQRTLSMAFDWIEAFPMKKAKS
ncbi:MAG: hypothetical protein L6R30_25410 [Thermoanaerobaculia bacterium]|nr:hypothetical protein [Thermoanaerobaculia bacterium]